MSPLSPPKKTLEIPRSGVNLKDEEGRGWRVIRRIRDRRNETNEEHVGGTIRGGLGDSNGSGIIRSQDREGERGGEKLVGDEEQRKRGGEGGTQKGSKLR